MVATEREALETLLLSTRKAITQRGEFWQAANQWQAGAGPIKGWQPETIGFYRALYAGQIGVHGKPDPTKDAVEA